MVLRHTVTFSRANCNIALSIEKCYSGKVPSMKNRTAIDNRRFVINKILFITVFAWCSNRGSTHFSLETHFS